MNITDCHCIPHLHKCSGESKAILFQCTCCKLHLSSHFLKQASVYLRLVTCNYYQWNHNYLMSAFFLNLLLFVKKYFERKKFQIKMSWFSTFPKQSFHASGKKSAKKWFEAPSLRRSTFSIRSVHREQRMSLLERIYFCHPTHRVPAWAGRTIPFHGGDSFLTYPVNRARNLLYQLARYNKLNIIFHLIFIKHLAFNLNTLLV